jgi:hypothetical protein
MFANLLTISAHRMGGTWLGLALDEKDDKVHTCKIGTKRSCTVNLLTNTRKWVRKSKFIRKGRAYLKTWYTVSPHVSFSYALHVAFDISRRATRKYNLIALKTPQIHFRFHTRYFKMAYLENWLVWLKYASYSLHMQEDTLELAT